MILMRNSIHTSLLTTAAYDAVSGSYFGHGDLPMLLGYAGCNGREPQLANCSGIRYNRPISQSCDNTRVAGVRCLGMLHACNRVAISKSQRLIQASMVQLYKDRR